MEMLEDLLPSFSPAIGIGSPLSLRHVITGDGEPLAAGIEMRVFTK